MCWSASPMPWGAWNISAGQLVAAASIAIITAINYVGVRSGNLTNTVLTVAKVGALIVLPILALVYMRVTPTFTPVVPTGALRPMASFGVIMIAVMWTYEGWYYVAFAAGEIKDAARNVPRALIYGTLALTAIYVAVNLSYVYALSLEEMSGVTRIAEKAVTALVGPGGAALVAASVVVSTFGCNVAGVIAASRSCFAMAADGRFFPAGGARAPGLPHAARRPAHHERLVGVPHADRRLRGALHLCHLRLGALRHPRRHRHLRAACQAARRATALSGARLSGDPGALRARLVRTRGRTRCSNGRPSRSPGSGWWRSACRSTGTGRPARGSASRGWSAASVRAGAAATRRRPPAG